MHPFFLERTRRKQRLAALAGLACATTLSFAGAQSDGAWLDRALEETERLASPWELPVEPQVHIPTGTPLSPIDNTQLVTRPETKPTPASVPTPASLPALGEAVKRANFEIQSVDEFEDPWEEENELDNIDLVLVDPWALEDPTPEPADADHPNKNAEATDALHEHPQLGSPSAADPDPEPSALETPPQPAPYQAVDDLDPWLD